MEFDVSQFIDATPVEHIGRDYLTIARSCIIPQGVIPPQPDTVCWLTLTEPQHSLLTRGSLSTFTGKAKAGKTTALAFLIASVISNKKVLWIDTEQGLFYSSLTQHYLLKVAGLSRSDNLQMIDIRQYNPTDRLSILEALLQDSKYDIVVLDGVRDVCFDINDPKEATNVITKLMAWSVDFNLHLAMVLHQNKGDSNARGHLGSEAVNKSEIVISVTKTPDRADIALIHAEYSRGLPFEDFFIARDCDGIPFIDSNHESVKKSGSRKLAEPIDVADSTHSDVLKTVFMNRQQLTSAEFISSLRAAWPSEGGDAMRDSRANVFKSYYIQQGFIVAKTRQSGNKTLIELSPEISESFNKNESFK